MNASYSAQFQNFLIRPLHEDDLEPLRNARNDADHAKYLAKRAFITPEMQAAWYASYLAEEGIYTWAMVETQESGCCVGSVAVYNFKGCECEVGKSMVLPSAVGRGIGPRCETMAMYVAYEKMDIERIYAYVDVRNAASIRHAEKCGLVMENRVKDAEGTDLYYFAASREDFMEKHAWIEEIVIF
jgi:RimJ/RimL family protein N-acetyltransferase